MFPNCLGPVIVHSTFLMGSAIIVASSLSFLGLGVPAPQPEWGAMLGSGRKYLSLAPHLTIVPGAALLLTVLAFNLAGDGLRDALDPRSAT